MSLNVSKQGNAVMTNNFEIEHPLSPENRDNYVQWPACNSGDQNRHSLDGHNVDYQTVITTTQVNIKEENMTLQWQNGLITNLEYLLYLNSSKYLI